MKLIGIYLSPFVRMVAVSRQVLGGLGQLNVAAAQIDHGAWIAGTPTISQADVTTTVAYTFANLARPHLQLAERFPQLARFAERCETLPAFVSAPLPAPRQMTSLLSQPFVREECYAKPA